MTNKQKILNKYKDAPDVKFCHFLANDGNKRKYVYMYDMSGIEGDLKKGHINLDLYYKTHRAMTISFLTRKDALDYVESKGKIDKRLVFLQHGTYVMP